MQINYTRVLKFLETCDFSLTSFLLHGVLQLDFVINFHRILTLVPFVQNKSYSSVSSLPDHFAELIVIEGPTLRNLGLHVLADHLILIVVSVIVIEVYWVDTLTTRCRGSDSTCWWSNCI